MQEMKATFADSMMRELSDAELTEVSGAEGENESIGDDGCRTVCYITIGGVTTRHCDPIGDG